LLYPVTRNSLWENVFGVSFERANKYHRFFATIAYLFVTIHMLLWYGYWLNQGVFSNNIVAVQNLLISGGNPANYVSFLLFLLSILLFLVFF